MFEQYYDSATRIRSLRNSACGSLLESFSEALCQVHYCVSRVRSHIRAAEHFIHFANRKDVAIAEVNEQLVEQFRDHQARCRCVQFRRTEPFSQVFGARLFLKHLRDTGVVTSAIVEPVRDVAAEPVLLTTFRQWMREQRGTSGKTLHDYCVPLRAFLELVGENPLHFNARRLREFVMRASRHCSQRGIQTYTTAIRAFIRFLVAEGRCAAGLEAAIPVFVHWRLASLPQYLQPDEVERVIDSCDTATSSGKRDRAILLLLARLGLRAGDIIRLRLGDIDWNEASVRVCGKGHRETRMPLTNEVGKAIVSYLKKGRPPTNSDVLFVRCVAAFHPLSSHTSVSKMVAKRMYRAGVKRPSRGAAHLLRHSVATSLLRQGVSLQDIAAILRHRSIETTQIYAKVDIPALRQVIQAWPEVQSC
jgi:site-specific recombinase XerD